MRSSVRRFHEAVQRSGKCVSQESQNVDGGEKVELEVYLMNGHRIAVTVKTDDDTDAVLEVCLSPANTS